MQVWSAVNHAFPGSFKAVDVLHALRRRFTEKGWPSFIRSDNGPEFIAYDLRTWLMATGAQTFYIQPGSPWSNGVGESFNSKLRDECLNAEAFSSRAEARVVMCIAPAGRGKPASRRCFGKLTSP